MINSSQLRESRQNRIDELRSPGDCNTKGKPKRQNIHHNARATQSCLGLEWQQNAESSANIDEDKKEVVTAGRRLRQGAGQIHGCMIKRKFRYDGTERRKTLAAYIVAQTRWAVRYKLQSVASHVRPIVARLPQGAIQSFATKVTQRMMTSQQSWTFIGRGLHLAKSFLDKLLQLALRIAD